MFCTMLKYKAEWDGKTYLEIDRFFPSSKTCQVCLNQVGNLPLNLREWTCDKCQTKHDRDINAAVNIRDVGLRLLRVRLAFRGNLEMQDALKTGGRASRLSFWSSSKAKQGYCLCKALNREGRIPQNTQWELSIVDIT